MRLVIISGRSGSGKSTALHVLEDIGFTCIDNLPASLLPNLAEQHEKLDDKSYAISIDVRNTADDLKSLPSIIHHSKVAELGCQVIFLDAADDILLQRFSETRRKHPLSDHNTDLREAITQERKRLRPVLDVADIVIDTSDMKYHDLRDLIKRRIMAITEDSTVIMFQSFGFKYGLPKDADLVYDIRCLPNPHWKKELRPLTGRDEPGKQVLSTQQAVEEMFEDIKNFLTRWLPRYEENNRSYITIAIGCTGGQHRSVYLSEKLAKHFEQTSKIIQLRHRELTNND